MQLKNLLFVFSLGIITSACESDDDLVANETLPEGALPSAEFTPNNLPDEPYADHAIKVIAQEGNNVPFYSLELMADGHYMLDTSRPYNSYATSVRVATKADGSFLIHKNRKAETMRTKINDENTTIDLGYGTEYGVFTPMGNGKYLLSNGIEVDLSDDTMVSYKNPNGTVSNVLVSTSKPVLDNATKSLCRMWDYNSEEVWYFLNNQYIAHGKQTLKDGQVESSWNSIADNIIEISKEDILDEDDKMCYRTIFTGTGKMIQFYLDGTAEVVLWSWENEEQGTLHYEDWMGNEDYTEEYYGFVTARFKGNQMRIYEDVMETEGGMTARIVAVHTLTSTY